MWCVRRICIINQNLCNTMCFGNLVIRVDRTMFLTVKSYRDVILDIVLCKKHNRVDGCEQDSSDPSLNWYWSLTLGL
uniref:Uncharacterized protein n=1 Tax=Acrobeloides nanus TaxID=290746 RepID=A0A914EFF0_9BILA